MVDGIFEYSKAHPFAYTALDYRSTRQDLIASNIANADTPFYRPKDVRFEEVLASKAQEVFAGDKSLELELAQTDGAHLDKFDPEYGKASIFFRDGHMARNDGNSVDLDVETSEMSKNAVMYSALVEGLKKHKAIFKGVLDASGRLS